MDLISVIIPAYNVEKYIDRCIESIVNQTYKYLEIIIVNDGSTDGTAVKCDLWRNKDSRIKVIHTKNKGVVSARNTGMEIAKGYYIGFVDADDYIDETMYQVLIENIQNADMSTVGCTKCFFDGTKTPLFDKYTVLDSCISKKIEDIISDMIYDSTTDEFHSLFPSIWNRLYKKTILLDIYKQIPEVLSYSEDACLLYLYVLKCKKIVFVGKPLYFYNIHLGSASNSKNLKFLTNVNEIYLTLLLQFEKNDYSNVLIEQLQKWVRYLTNISLDTFMGFDHKYRTPRFLIDTFCLQGKSVAVYAAGSMGKDVMWMLSKQNIDVVLWVDKNYNFYQQMGLNVNPVDDLLKKDFDILVIAVSNLKVFTHIKDDLISLGIKEEKLYWQEPIHIY